MDDADQFLRPSYSRTLILALWRQTRDSIRMTFPVSPQSHGSTSPMSLSPQRPHSGQRGPRKSVSTFRTVGMMVLVTFLLVSVPGIDACGPGRGAGRRRAPRKLTPLVFQQHVPNVPENALSASGLSEGKILRGDSQRFKDLVPNYNLDIIFRDDEGTGADRLMTHKLGEKLNTLAISVMNQWPGVKLRVIEGWDEDLHSEKSLHYEGRAVDIQTSDKDTSKYGMLARLAVEAGFDWVYYEARSHIHCSVKSDSFQSGRAGGCFSSNSTVTTPSGPMRISDLRIGDQVLTVDDSSGTVLYAPVLLFLDRNQSEIREFYEIRTLQNTSLSLTPSHLLYIIPSESQVIRESSSYFANFSPLDDSDYSNEALLALAQITFARNIAIGDWILTLDPTNRTILQRELVTDVRSVMDQGVYAPLTTTGTILVDGVLSSCYAVIESQSLAHWSFLPIRLLHNLGQGLANVWRHVNLLVTLGGHLDRGGVVNILSQQISPETRERRSSSSSAGDDGVYWYASFLYEITHWILPSSFLYKS